MRKSKMDSIKIKRVELDKARIMIQYPVFTKLSSSIEKKDDYTYGHSNRVAWYSVIIGKRIGLPADKLLILEKAALLHDIGKINVPDYILQKDNKLTSKEYQTVKMHAVIGYEILKTMTDIEDLYLTARHHHERYDGAGYPDGLKGMEIPLFARIVAVADTFDAMTSDRPYRKALDKETVIKELRHASDTQLDPYLCDIMIELIKNKKFRW